MRRSRIDERTAERLLAGRKDVSQDEQGLAQLVAAINDTTDRGVAPKTADTHITRITEAARAHAHAEPETTRTPATAPAAVASTRRESLMDRSKALALKLSGSVVAMSMATFGLAHAGVDLPGQAAEEAFSAVGVELPNQEAVVEVDESAEAEGNAVSEDVQAVIDGTEERGCEFGQAVAAAASQNSQDEDEAVDTEASDSPCTEGESDTDTDDAEAQGSKATGEEKSAEGKAKAEEAKTKSSTAPAGSQATGEEKSSTAPSGSQSTGEEKSETAPSGSQSTGEEKSSTAPSGSQSTGEEKSEGRRP